MGGTQGGAFFLDQDKPNQGRKVKSWHPRQKENVSGERPNSPAWRADRPQFYPLPPDAPEAG